MFRIIWLAILLSIYSLPAISAEIVEVSLDHKAIRIGPEMDIFIDDGASLTIGDLQSEGYSDRFVPASKPVPHLDFVQGRVWLHFRLKNADSVEIRRILALNMPATLRAVLYRQRDDGAFDSKRRGWLEARPAGAQRTLVPSFEIVLPPGQVESFYLSVEADVPFMMDLNIYDPGHFLNRDSTIRSGYNVYALLALMFLVYHLSVFFLNRKRSYLLLAAFSINYALMFYFGSGNSAVYLPDSLVSLSRYGLPFFGTSAIFSGMLFVREFASTPLILPRFDKVLLGIVILFFMLMIATFLIPKYVLMISSVLGSLALLVQIIVPAFAFKKGQESALIYLIGVLLFSVVGLEGLFLVWGIITPNPIVAAIPASGSIIITIMASLALVQQSRHMETRYCAQVYKLNWQLATLEEREHRRIAEDLHDSVCQQLSGVKLQFSHLKAGENDKERQEQFKLGIESISTAIKQARKVMSDLSPPLLHNLGLRAALEDTVIRLKQQHGLSAMLSIDGDETLLDVVQPALLYRIVQELSTNTLKHAQASALDIRLSYSPDTVLLSVSDDGKGFDPDQIHRSVTTTSGLGLLNLKNQVEQLGGRFTVDSIPNQRTAIHILIPVPEILKLEGETP